jgi:hypothetical protein
MSLEALRDLRRQGGRPDAPVILLIGTKPAWLADDCRVVCLPATATPESIDFRPLFGLWVAVLLTEPLNALAGKVLAAMEAVQAKVYGLALADGSVHLGILEPTEEHTLNLRRTWELYAVHRA